MACCGVALRRFGMAILAATYLLTAPGLAAANDTERSEPEGQQAVYRASNSADNS